MATSANNELNETNVLMMRYGFHSAKNADDQPWFDLFDLLILTFILTERDGFYQLEVDREFSRQLFEIGEFDLPSEEDKMFSLIALCVRRLEIRVHLTSLIMKEEKRILELNRNFDICDDETWRNCRFSRICQLMKEKLSDANKKRAFLDVFSRGHNNHVTYF